MHWRESACVITLLVAVAASRAPYLALAWFPLLPALEKRPVTWRNLQGPLCCTAAVILIVAAWQYRMRPIGMPLATGANPAAQMLMLVRHPWSAVPGLALETLQAVRPMFPGGVSLLGTNDASPPRPYAWALVAATAALIAATPMACLRSRALRAGVFATLFLIATGISAIAWLMWTVAGLHRVDGLQARYFLPLCVWAFLLLPRTSMASGRVQAMLWRGGIATIALLTLSLPWFAARVFYKMGLAAALRLALQ